MSDLTSNIETRMGTERNFGLIFAAVFAAFALWSNLAGSSLLWPAIAASATFLALALLRPGVLRGANVAWFRFGNALHALVSPVIMLLIYAVAFLPFGLVFRLIGKDPLARAIDPAAESYWICRGAQPGDMKLQF